MLTAAFINGEQAVNTAMSTFQERGGRTALLLQASVTVAHGMFFMFSDYYP